jgi:hypothetical protein
MKNYNSIHQTSKTKTIKFLLIIVIFIFTKFNSFAQTPPTQPFDFLYPFTDNFNNYIANDPIQFYSAWLGGEHGLAATPDHGVNSTMSLSINFIPTITSDSLTGAFGPFNSASELSFSYRFVEYAGTAVSGAYVLNNDDYLSIDFISYPDSVPTQLALINRFNHIESTDFKDIVISLAGIANDSGFVTFNFHGVDTLDHWIDMDNIVFSGGTTVTPATSVIEKLTNFKIYTDNDRNINIINQTYDPSKGKNWYKVFDLSGKLLSSASFSSRETVNTSNWTSGVYLVEIQNNASIETKKIIIQ